MTATETDAPKKERWTFSWKHLHDEVVTTGLCTGCAGCVVVCPHDVLGYNDQDGVYKPFQTEADYGDAADCSHGDKACTTCTRACPRFRTWEPEIDEFMFGRARTVDEPSGLRSTGHIWWDARADWEVPDGLPTADEVDALDVAFIEEIAQGFGQRREGRFEQRRRRPIARQVPGDGPVAPRGEMVELRRPALGIGPHAMQEDQNARARALLVVSWQAHASSPRSTPASTTAVPSSRTVQPRNGRSKWPSVCRPAVSLAPVE